MPDRTQELCRKVGIPELSGGDAATAAAIERIAELEAALRVAQPALRDAHEVAIRKATNTWWEPLEKQMREAHDAVTKALG